MKLNEVRKEDDYYFIGPFWIIANSLNELNKGKFDIKAYKFLVDYEGNYLERVPKSQFTHKGIWENENHSFLYNYYPRGRVSIDKGITYVNIPKGLNEKLVIDALSKSYSFDKSKVVIKHTDPTSGNHYNFLMN